MDIFLKAPVTMEGGKISVQFPQYHFTAEIVDDKLIMVGEGATYSLHFFSEMNNSLNKSICSFNTRLSLILFFSFLRMQTCVTPGEKGVTFKRINKRI